MEIKINDPNAEKEKQRMELVRRNMGKLAGVISGLFANPPSASTEQPGEAVSALLSHVESIKGERGEKGEQGDPGIDGINGFDGNNGLNGKDGEVGPQGEPGKDGKKGKDGKDGKDGKNTDPIEVIKALRKLPEKDKLDLKDLRNSTALLSALGKMGKLDMSDMRWHGGGIVTIQKSGVEVTHTATVLNFTGAGVSTVTESGGVVTINITGGGGTGTVTSVSVISANGFAGSVATDTTTPAITLSTTITGVLKGNGTAILAAVAGTDYQAPITLTTTGSSGAATFVGNVLNIPQYSGGGTGITRSVNVVSTNTAAGSTASTDYVYIISGTTTLTLPTAVGNTNRYTAKNAGANTVTIATTSAQTIDGSVGITLTATPANMSRDFISDGSNWKVI